MEFEVNMVYQKEDIEALQKGTAIRRYRGRPMKRFFHCLAVFFCIYLLLVPLLAFFPTLLGALGVVPIERGAVALYPIAIVTALALTVYDQWGYRQRVASWLAWRKIRKGKKETIRFQFLEEDFRVHTAEADARNNYSVIQAALEGPAHYLLFIGQNQAYILDKKNFLEGDPAVFGVWISSKIGKEIIKMR